VGEDEVTDGMIGGFELRHGGFPGLAQGFALRATEHAATQEHDVGGRIHRADGRGRVRYNRP